MKKILLIFLLIFTSCSTIKYVPVKETEYITVTETVVDTVIKWVPPIEKIVNETKDTTSTVETSLAKSIATVSNGTLHHEIENKKDSVKTKIVYKDKIITKTVSFSKFCAIPKLPSSNSKSSPDIQRLKP